jgi:hypothetical protein
MRAILVVTAIAAAVLAVPLILIIFPSHNNVPLITTYSIPSTSATGATNRSTETITISALLPLTGTLSSSGESSYESLKAAVEDVGEYFLRQIPTQKYNLL